MGLPCHQGLVFIRNNSSSLGRESPNSVLSDSTLAIITPSFRYTVPASGNTLLLALVLMVFRMVTGQFWPSEEGSCSGSFFTAAGRGAAGRV